MSEMTASINSTESLTNQKEQNPIHRKNGIIGKRNKIISKRMNMKKILFDLSLEMDNF